MKSLLLDVFLWPAPKTWFILSENWKTYIHPWSHLKVHCTQLLNCSLKCSNKNTIRPFINFAQEICSRLLCFSWVSSDSLSILTSQWNYILPLPREISRTHCQKYGCFSKKAVWRITIKAPSILRRKLNGRNFFEIFTQKWHWKAPGIVHVVKRYFLSLRNYFCEWNEEEKSARKTFVKDS